MVALQALLADRLTTGYLSLSRDQSRKLCAASWVINQSIDRYLDYEEWFSEAVGEGIAAADRGDLVSHDEAMAAARERIAKASE